MFMRRLALLDALRDESAEDADTIFCHIGRPPPMSADSKPSSVEIDEAKNCGVSPETFHTRYIKRFEKIYTTEFDARMKRLEPLMKCRK